MLTTTTLSGTYRTGPVGDVLWRKIEGYCLSADTKPTEHVLNGSSLIEMDTGKVYFFDEENAKWREFGG